MAGTRAAVIVDRDGVINDTTDYLTSWEMFHFIPGALDALAKLNEAGWLVVMATNQSVIGLGMLSREGLDDVHARMRAAIEEAGGRIEQVYLCPHRDGDGCECRKPEPGMLLQAAEDWDLDLSRCYFIGDSWRDIKAGQRAGVTTILTEGVEDGRPQEQLARLDTPPDMFVPDLAAAVDAILEREAT